MVGQGPAVLAAGAGWVGCFGFDGPSGFETDVSKHISE